MTDAETAPPGVIASGLEKPDIGKTEHTGIYSSSGFDVLGALVRFVNAS
jgi:pre-rRNA-processing protein SRD1